MSILLNSMRMSQPLPYNVPGLTAWYDFSDSRYLNLAGNAIISIADKSGNGNNLDAQSTPTKRPTFTANQQNGLPAAVFDNGDTLIGTAVASLAAITGGGNTCFVASKQSTAAATDYIYDIGAAASHNYIAYVAGGTDKRFQSRSLDSNGVVSTVGNTNNFELLCGRRSGTTQALSVNNGTGVTNSSGQDATSNSIWIGSRLDSDGYLTGVIGEILFYNSSLSAGARTIINSYLANKWGVAIS